MSRPRRFPCRSPWAALLYLAGVLQLCGFLVLPMYRLTEIDEGETIITQRTGWEFLGETWRVVTGSIQVGIPPLPLIPWWLVNAPVMILVVVSTIPGAGLLWLAGHSPPAAWLGRVWWALLFFGGPFWYLWESGPPASSPVLYEQLLGVNLMVFGTFLIAVAFWFAAPKPPHRAGPRLAAVRPGSVRSCQDPEA